MFSPFYITLSCYFSKKMKKTLSKSSQKAHIILILFYIQDVVDCSLKSTYILSRYGKIPKAYQEIIFWPLFTSTSICLTYVA